MEHVEEWAPREYCRYQTGFLVENKHPVFLLCLVILLRNGFEGGVDPAGGDAGPVSQVTNDDGQTA